MNADELAQATLNKLAATPDTRSKGELLLVILKVLAEVVGDYTHVWAVNQLPMHERSAQDVNSGERVRAFNRNQAEFYRYFVDLVPRLEAATADTAESIFGELETRAAVDDEGDHIASMLGSFLYIHTRNRLIAEDSKGVE